MKALTLWQPWASLVSLGVKTIETRSWDTKYRGPLAIHAAIKKPNFATVGNYDIDRFFKRAPYRLIGPRCNEAELPLGAVVATCELVDVVPIGYPKIPAPNNKPGIQHSIHEQLLLSYPGQAIRDIGDQLPYGDYSDKRFAWLLTDIKPCGPIPAKGRQGLWEWNTEALAIAEGITA